MWEGFPYFVEINKTIIVLLKTGFLLFEKNYHFQNSLQKIHYLCKVIIRVFLHESKIR